MQARGHGALQVALWQLRGPTQPGASISGAAPQPMRKPVPHVQRAEIYHFARTPLDDSTIAKRAAFSPIATKREDEEWVRRMSPSYKLKAHYVERFCYRAVLRQVLRMLQLALLYTAVGLVVYVPFRDSHFVVVAVIILEGLSSILISVILAVL